jgi:formate dehydrogenase subunit delta
MSSQQQLVQMANDIGNFFRSEPRREDAVAAIANHIKAYWTVRMREKLIAQLQHGDAALDELPLAAVQTLIDQPNARPEVPPPGGDAG